MAEILFMIGWKKLSDMIALLIGQCVTKDLHFLTDTAKFVTDFLPKKIPMTTSNFIYKQY